MDGGRFLHSLLALRSDCTHAMQIVAMVGQDLAYLLGLVGLFSNTFLEFIANFKIDGNLLSDCALAAHEGNRKACLRDDKRILQNHPF